MNVVVSKSLISDNFFQYNNPISSNSKLKRFCLKIADAESKAMGKIFKKKKKQCHKFHAPHLFFEKKAQTVIKAIIVCELLKLPNYAQLKT